jgi:hypothetical protein
MGGSLWDGAGERDDTSKGGIAEVRKHPWVTISRNHSF